MCHFRRKVLFLSWHKPQSYFYMWFCSYLIHVFPMDLDGVTDPISHKQTLEGRYISMWWAKQVLISGRAIVSAGSCREHWSINYICVSSLKTWELYFHNHTPVNHWLRPPPEETRRQSCSLREEPQDCLLKKGTGMRHEAWRSWVRGTRTKKPGFRQSEQGIDNVLYSWVLHRCLMVPQGPRCHPTSIYNNKSVIC